MFTNDKNWRKMTYLRVNYSTYEYTAVVFCRYRLHRYYEIEPNGRFCQLY